MKRSEYPRPDLVRDIWWPLNGTWNFAFDNQNVGLNENWFLKLNFPLRIEVPFAFQTKLSGIDDQSFHDHMWYHREISIKPFNPNKRYLLHFQAVDYECRVYLDGLLVGMHTGGQAPFSFEITSFIKDESAHQLVVYVFDPSTDLFLPRGKQYWKPMSESIWYTRTSGIYQSVWIEEVASHYVQLIKMTPLFDDGVMQFDINVSGIGRDLKIEIFDKGHLVAEQAAHVTALSQRMNIEILHSKEDFEAKTWHPDHPYLFDVVISYGADQLKTYLGMRKVSTKEGQILINNKPYYLKLILDQGYWPNGLLTAPTIEDLQKDIVLSKSMGFNGARKHQKCEDPYFHFFADKLGYLVWGEMASSVQFSELSAWRDLNEWRQIIPRDYNHPSIIAWVPLNESWGVPEIKWNKRQQQHAIDLYDTIRDLDKTRLIVGNDGWEMVKTDICAVHHYRHGSKEDLKTQAKYRFDLATKDNILASRPADRPLYAEGYKHKGEPILLTEFGGISYAITDEGWGYTNVESAKDFLNEYRRLIKTIKDSVAIAGFCYTQLTDVEYEINGLLTYDRRPKVTPKDIKEINDLI